MGCTNRLLCCVLLSTGKAFRYIKLRQIWSQKNSAMYHPRCIQTFYFQSSKVSFAESFNSYDLKKRIGIWGMAALWINLLIKIYIDIKLLYMLISKVIIGFIHRSSVWCHANNQIRCQANNPITATPPTTRPFHKNLSVIRIKTQTYFPKYPFIISSDNIAQIVIFNG